MQTKPLFATVHHTALSVPVAAMSLWVTTPALADWNGVGSAITKTKDGILDNVMSPIAILAVIIVMVTAFVSRGLALLAFFIILAATAVAFNSEGIIAIVGGSGGSGE